MSVLNTKHKRKSAAITALILMLLIFGIFNFGMQYLDPPEEYGVAINFGDANVGFIAAEKNLEKIVSKEVAETAVITKEVLKETIVEEFITKETIEEVPVVEKIKKTEHTSAKKIIKKELPKIVPKPKPSKENIDALNNLLKGNLIEAKQKGKGDDVIDGFKGKKEGDLTSSKYYGNTGNDAGGNYNLAGRKALSKPKKQPDCQEEGIVVVRITVDKTGKVIRAIPGVKGTTNTAPCLAKPAKEAALSTVWNSDADAPKIQTGTIIYKFSLSN